MRTQIITVPEYEAATMIARRLSVELGAPFSVSRETVSRKPIVTIDFIGNAQQLRQIKRFARLYWATLKPFFRYVPPRKSRVGL